MNDLRKAAEMALVALNSFDPHDDEFWYSERSADEIDSAITALRQALAQLEQEPVMKFKVNVIDDEHPNGIPLEQWGNTPPPKREWKGLTIDDKHFLLANAWNKEQAFDGFMDAIDKFLEEKNT